MNNGCPGNGWSVIASAPTNSQLAGVLAGFVFTGILILFNRPGPKNTQTISLFTTTFVVLAFASYLFSLVSGGAPDPVCARVWSEAMAASGMLGAGGVALIGGIAWLLVHHGDDDPGSAVDLERLSRFLLFGVAAAVMLLLTATTLDYFEVVLNRREPAWLTWLVTLSPLGFGAMFAGMRVRRSRKDVDVTRTLSATSFGLLTYAVIGPVYAGTLTNLPTAWWTSTPVVLIVLGVVIGLLMPAGLLIALLLSAPPPPLQRVRESTGTQESEETA